MKNEMPEKVNCLYCGKPTSNKEYVINPEASKELLCCGESCFAKTKEFIAWDNKTRTLLYVILFVMVVANLFLFGFNVLSRFRYLPMIGICVSVLIFPSVFARYERYQSLGINKTQKVIRCVAVALLALAVALTITG